MRMTTAVLAVIAVPIAFCCTFSTFRFYDDEGYLLDVIFAAREGVDLLQGYFFGRPTVERAASEDVPAAVQPELPGLPSAALA